jgi:hypothetical protein
VEAKSFEFAFEEGVSVVRVYKRRRGIMHYVSLRKASVYWLLATMQVLLLAKGSKEFLKSSRVASKAYFARTCIL